jgi:ketosteroid isomerase-like protein
MKQVFILLLAASFTLMACNSAPAPTVTQVEEKKDSTLSPDAIKKIVEERNHLYNTAMVTGDSLNLVNHFTEDCVVMAPNMEQLKGKTALIPALMAYSKMGIKQFTDETTRVMAAGDYIYEEGNYFLGGDKGITLDKGKYACIWKQENGEWRVFSDIWNTSLPAPVAKK